MIITICWNQPGLGRGNEEGKLHFGVNENFCMGGPGKYFLIRFLKLNFCIENKKYFLFCSIFSSLPKMKNINEHQLMKIWNENQLISINMFSNTSGMVMSRSTLELLSKKVMTSFLLIFTQRSHCSLGIFKGVVLKP